MKKYFVMILIIALTSLRGEILAASTSDDSIAGQIHPLQWSEVRNSSIEQALPSIRFKLDKNHNQGKASPRLIGFHVSIENGLFFTKGVEDLIDVFQNWGFGDDVTSYGWIDYSWSNTVNYPSGHSDKFYKLRNLKIEFSLSKRFRIGYMYSPFHDFKVQGFKYIKRPTRHPDYPIYTGGYGNTLTGEFSGKANYLFLSYILVGSALPKKSSIKAAAGIGWSDIDFDLIYGEINHPKAIHLCYYGLLEYDFYFSQYMSIGFNLDYKGIPYKIEASTLLGTCFPEVRVNFGGFGLGINFGLHI